MFDDLATNNLLPLYKAVNQGDVVYLKSVLSVDQLGPNERDPQGKTPLHRLFRGVVQGCTVHTRQRMLALLLEYGTDVTILDESGVSSLELIVTDERIDAFAVALDYLKFKPNLIPLAKALYYKFGKADKVQNRLVQLREAIKSTSLDLQIRSLKHATSTGNSSSNQTEAIFDPTEANSELEMNVVSDLSFAYAYESSDSPPNASKQAQEHDGRGKSKLSRKERGESKLSRTNYKKSKPLPKSKSNYRSPEKFEKMDLHTLLLVDYHGAGEKFQFEKRFTELMAISTSATKVDCRGNTPLMVAFKRRTTGLRSDHIYAQLIERSRSVLYNKDIHGDTAFISLLRGCRIGSLHRPRYDRFREMFVSCGYKLSPREQELETRLKLVTCHSSSLQMNKPQDWHTLNFTSVHKLLQLEAKCSENRTQFLAKLSETLTSYPSSIFERDRCQSTPLVFALSNAQPWPFEVVSLLIKSSRAVINYPNATNETAYSLFLKQVIKKNYVYCFKELHAEFFASGLKLSQTDRVVEVQLNQQLKRIFSEQDWAAEHCHTDCQLARKMQTTEVASLSRGDVDKNFWHRLTVATTFEDFKHEIINASRETVKYSLSCGLSPFVILKTKKFSEEDNAYLVNILKRASGGEIIDKRKVHEYSSMKYTDNMQRFDDVFKVKNEKMSIPMIEETSPPNAQSKNLLELLRNSDPCNEIIVAVLSSGNCDLSEVNSDGFNALMLALLRKDVSRGVIEKLMNMETVNYMSENGDCALSALVVQNYPLDEQKMIIIDFVGYGLELKPQEGKPTYFEVLIECGIELNILELLFELGLELTPSDVEIAIGTSLDVLDIVLDYIPRNTLETLLPNVLLLVVAKHCSEPNLLRTVRRLVKDFKVNVNYVSTKSEMSLIHFLISFSENANLMSVLLYLLNLEILDFDLDIAGKGNPLEYAVTLGKKNLVSRLRRVEVSHSAKRIKIEPVSL